MTVNPGFGGQDYLAAMEPKVAEVRAWSRRPAATIDDRGGRRDQRGDDRSARPRPGPTSSWPAPRCTAIPRGSGGRGLRAAGQGRGGFRRLTCGAGLPRPTPCVPSILDGLGGPDRPATARPRSTRWQAQVARAKAGEPLRPVTVVVPSNYAGVAARRALARRGGVAGLTWSRCTDWPSCWPGRHWPDRAGSPSRRRSCRPRCGRRCPRNRVSSDPVADQPSTVEALRRAHRELRDLGPEAELDALPGRTHGPRPCWPSTARVTAQLSAAWYDETDLMAAASGRRGAGDTTERTSTAGRPPPPGGDQPRRAAAARAGRARSVTVLLGGTGTASGPAGARGAVGRSPPAGRLSPGSDGPPRPVELVVAADEDDEVRAAAAEGAPRRRGRHPARAGGGGVRARRGVRPAAGRPPRRRPPPLERGDGRAAGRAGRRPHAARPCSTPTSPSCAGATCSRCWPRPRRPPAGRWPPGNGWPGRPASSPGGTSGSSGSRPSPPRDRDRAVPAPRRRGARPRARTGREERAERAEELAQFVAMLADLLEPPASRTWSAYAAWSRTLLDHVLGPTVATVVDGRPTRSAPRRRSSGVLDRLARLDAVATPRACRTCGAGRTSMTAPAPAIVDRAVLRAAVDAELSDGLRTVGRLGEGLFVGPIPLAVGIETDLVIVLGLVEGGLPGVLSDDPLLAEASRRRTGGALRTAADRRAQLHHQLLAVAGSGRRDRGRQPPRRRAAHRPGAPAVALAGRSARRRAAGPIGPPRFVPRRPGIDGDRPPARRLGAGGLGRRARRGRGARSRRSRPTLWPATTTRCATRSPSPGRAPATASPPSTATWPSWPPKGSTSPPARPTAPTALEAWARCPFALLRPPRARCAGARPTRRPADPASHRPRHPRPRGAGGRRRPPPSPPATCPARANRGPTSVRAALQAELDAHCRAAEQPRATSAPPLHWRQEQRRLRRRLDGFLTMDLEARTELGGHPEGRRAVVRTGHAGRARRCPAARCWP